MKMIYSQRASLIQSRLSSVGGINTKLPINLPSFAVLMMAVCCIVLLVSPNSPVCVQLKMNILSILIKLFKLSHILFI